MDPTNPRSELNYWIIMYDYDFWGMGTEYPPKS